MRVTALNYEANLYLIARVFPYENRSVTVCTSMPPFIANNNFFFDGFHMVMVYLKEVLEDERTAESP